MTAQQPIVKRGTELTILGYHAMGIVERICNDGVSVRVGRWSFLFDFKRIEEAVANGH